MATYREFNQADLVQQQQQLATAPLIIDNSANPISLESIELKQICKNFHYLTTSQRKQFIICLINT